MPSVVADGPFVPLSNSANSSFDAVRKSSEKTLGGVFAYTNGTDVETGLPEHRLDQLKTIKNSSRSSLTNGVHSANGSIKGVAMPPRERRHSKTGSVSSIGSGTARHSDPTTDPQKQLPPSQLTKLSTVENAADQQMNGAPPRVQRPVDFEKTRTSSTPAPSSSYDAQSPPRNPSKTRDFGGGNSDGTHLSPPPAHGPSFHRFSSPPGMSPGAAIQDHGPSGATDFPKLTQRHTLQLPKAQPPRASRDFSFVAGPSEEVLSASGRFSPTHDTPRHRRGSLGLLRRPTRSMQSDAHIDELIPDEDAIRWTEAIRQKRISRRKRKEEEEDDDRVVVGKKVEEGHVNWVIAYNMLTGIRFTVSRINAKMGRELTDADFQARHKFSFDITGTELTPSAKYDFKFKDYSPWVFRQLRLIFGLDPADYLMSLTSKYILSELGSPGKSGSFFYFSRDYKYIIKTIHHAEHKLLRKVLKDYYKHVIENPNTLISQFYGLHRVKIPYGRKIHFVVMNNLFPPHRDIHHMFDLKGSTVGRDFREEDMALNPRATLKDLNWLRRDLHLEFDEKIKQVFIEQLRRDVALLQRLHIMDYSLLVGMHDMEKGNDENLRENTLQVFQPGGEESMATSDERHNLLMRTPSRLENAKKARELRLTLKKEKPVPMRGLPVSAKMPSNIDDERRGRIFYGDDGGIRATRENGRRGEEIYYLGVIDCLTHYGFLKRVEHYWKGLSHSRTQISPIPPQAYGDRFINFVSGITMTPEEAQRRKEQDTAQRNSQGQSIRSQPPQIPAIEGAVVDEKATRTSDVSQAPRSPMSPPQSPTPASVERTMRKAHKQLGREDKAAEKDKRHVSEDEVPERTLATTETTERTLLPVIGEAGENSNSNSAANSRGKSPAGIRMVSNSTAGDADEHAVDREAEDDTCTNGLSKRSSDDPSVLRKLTASPSRLEAEKSVVGTDGYLTGLERRDRLSPDARSTA